jgi:hypothetical protein
MLADTTIETAAFVLADHAEIVNGKLYTMGAGWDRLTLPEDNLRVPSIAVAVILRVPWTASNQPHSWQVGLTDENGENILNPSPSGKFETGRPPGAPKGSPSTVMFTFTLANFELPKLGAYSARLEIDGSEIAVAPFSVFGKA